MTFQQCLMSTFSDMVEDTIEVFVDDISIVGDSFDCSSYLYQGCMKIPWPCGVIMDFIKDFPKIAYPLYKLSGKECMFLF